MGLSGIFLGSLTLLTVLGTSKFIDYSFHLFNLDIPFVIAIGVLPYPFTFLCTDLISELYGRTKANQVVWMGLILNVWVIFFVWISGVLDPPEVLIDGLPEVSTNGDQIFIPQEYAFYQLKVNNGGYCCFNGCILQLNLLMYIFFSFLKAKTNGKKLGWKQCLYLFSR